MDQPPVAAEQTKLAERVQYVGSGEHKGHPSFAGPPDSDQDSGMTPPRATLDLLASRKSLPRGCVRRFALARILGETLWLPNSQAGIITRERTARQKRNRAFAAELLAPAAQLMTRIQLDEITSEEVKDLAEEFSVSAFVIENQIRHHQLAIISG